MNHIGRVTEIVVGEKTYKLSRFTRKILARFIDWADKTLPHPLAELKQHIDGFPEPIQKLLVEEALEKHRLRKSINNPDIQALMQTNEGLLKVLCLLFQEYNPGMTDDEVADVFDRCVLEHGEDYLPEKIQQATGVLEIPESEGAEKKA